jgi:hypothetical protein
MRPSSYFGLVVAALARTTPAFSPDCDLNVSKITPIVRVMMALARTTSAFTPDPMRPPDVLSDCSASSVKRVNSASSQRFYSRPGALNHSNFPTTARLIRESKLAAAIAASLAVAGLTLGMTITYRYIDHPFNTHYVERPRSPSGTIREYFNAINRHDFRTAWLLGGRSAGQSYITFANSFRGKTPVAVTIASVKEPTVIVYITTSGTTGTETYRGIFEVKNSIIIHFDLQRITRVAIPEGSRVSQITALLGKDTAFKQVAFAAALRDPSALGLPSFARGNPEGYLFPATYDILPGTTAPQVLRGMVQRFKHEAQSVNLAGAAKAGQLSKRQVIIVASLIQAEGGRTSDFPKIAEVIYNRLSRGMKLQLDSTVFYAMNKFGIQATTQDLNTKSPYNTYQRTGLPPTPIDSPGAAAINAALHPAHGNLLYFVTVDPKNKITKFTESATQFEQFRAELANNLKNH